MANIKNLTDKILEEANSKRDEMINNANLEKDRVIEGKISEAKTIENQILQKAKVEASTKKERILSNAQLVVRNQKLQAKQQIVETVFNKVLEELCNISKDDFTNFVKSSVLSLDLEGIYTLVLNESGKLAVTPGTIGYLNSELSKKEKQCEIKLSTEVRNFRGGFILEKNGIELNNTFEALVESTRDELENEVIKVLFS